jgi:hypothetical protein
MGSSRNFLHLNIPQLSLIVLTIFLFTTICVHVYSAVHYTGLPSLPTTTPNPILRRKPLFITLEPEDDDYMIIKNKRNSTYSIRFKDGSIINGFCPEIINHLKNKSTDYPDFQMLSTCAVVGGGPTLLKQVIYRNNYPKYLTEIWRSY